MIIYIYISYILYSMNYSKFRELILKSTILTSKQKKDYLSRAIFYSSEVWKEIINTINNAEKKIININNDKKYNKQAILLSNLEKINKKANIEEQNELLEIEKKIDNLLVTF